MDNLSDIIIKQAKDNPLAVVKDNREMLLTRIESFTSKEVSDACRCFKDEKVLDRVAQMCEKLSNSQINPSPPVITIANLSKYNTDSLFKVIDELEKTPPKLGWSLHDVEKLSQTIFPEKLLPSIQLIQELHRSNESTFDPLLKIDENKMIRALSEFANSVDQAKFEECIPLGKLCMEKHIQPDGLYQTLTHVSKKNPTTEQFNKVKEELSKLIPTLKIEFEVALGFVTDMSGDEKRFVKNKPDWTLSSIASKAEKMSPDEFLKFLPTVGGKDEIRYEEPQDVGEALKEIKENYVRLSPEIGMVAIVGGQKYKPDLKKYCELLHRFTKTLNEAKSPDDPKLKELKEAFSEIYTEEYSENYARKVFNDWKGKGSRWSCGEIAERWVPNEIGILLSRMCAVREQKEVDDARRIMEALGKNNIPFKVSMMPWPKDSNAHIMNASGGIQAYIRNVVSEFPRCFIGEGGTSICGPGFMVFSDSVKTSEINAFKLLHPEIRTYELPTGYTTVRLPDDRVTKEKYPNLAGQDVLLGTGHIDTVIGVIPRSCVKEGKPIMLVDPRYYKELNNNPVFNLEFERLLMEQGLERRVVVIPEEEAHLNTANFAVVKKDGKDFVVINEANKTINMLLEKGLREDRMIVVKVGEMHAFRGSIGCCVSLVREDEEVITP